MMNQRNSAARECLNCFGEGHVSAHCVEAPKCRRCFDCGKSGGKQNHREWCPSKWYDLTIRPPRNPDGSVMVRAECIQMMREEFVTEKSRRANGGRAFDDRDSTFIVEGVRRETIVDEESIYGTVNSEESDDEQDENEVIELSDSDGSVIEAKMNSDDELEKLAELETEASTTLKRVRDRIDEIYRKRIATIPRNTRMRPPLEMLSLSDSNPRVPKIKPEEKSVTKRHPLIKSENPKPTVAQPKVTFQVFFQGASKMYLAEGNRGEVELSQRAYRMANGFEVVFAGSTLEMRGNPFADSRFQILSIGSPMQFTVGPSSVIVNNEFVLSSDGVAKNTNLSGSVRVADHTMTIMGPEQNVVRALFNKKLFVIFIEASGVAVREVAN